MGHCLGAAPSIGSDVMRNSTVQGVMPESPKSLEGRNLVNTWQVRSPSASTQRVDANVVVTQ